MCFVPHYPPQDGPSEEALFAAEQTRWACLTRTGRKSKRAAVTQWHALNAAQSPALHRSPRPRAATLGSVKQVQDDAVFAAQLQEELNHGRSPPSLDVPPSRPRAATISSSKQILADAKLAERLQKQYEAADKKATKAASKQIASDATLAAALAKQDLLAVKQIANNNLAASEVGSLRRQLQGDR